MKTAVLFSGGKDSTYSAWLTKKKGHELTCLISVFSKNKDSYMFHTPSIKRVKKQAKSIGLPLLIKRTKGKKEEELKDLKKIIAKAKKKFNIQALVTGALHSKYQASRIQKICDDLDIKCINPLWHKDEIKYLEELIKNKFEIVIIAVAAYPLNAKWLGRKINKDFVNDTKRLKEKYKIHPAGEGGEFETFVLNCPLFKKPLRIKNQKISGKGNAWEMEIKIK